MAFVPLNIRQQYSEREAGIRTLLGEAGNQGPTGMQAVANVIYNRQVAGTFGGDLYQVIRPSQFNGFDTNTPVGSARWNEAAAAWDARTNDITGGAYYFANPTYSTANWALQLNPSNSLQIGDHFFTNDANLAAPYGMAGQALDPRAPVAMPGDPLNSSFNFDQNWNYGQLDAAWDNPGNYMTAEQAAQMYEGVPLEPPPSGVTPDGTLGTPYVPEYAVPYGSGMNPYTAPSGGEYGPLPDAAQFGNTAAPDPVAPAGQGDLYTSPYGGLPDQSSVSQLPQEPGGGLSGELDLSNGGWGAGAPQLEGQLPEGQPTFNPGNQIAGATPGQTAPPAQAPQQPQPQQTAQADPMQMQAQRITTIPQAIVFHAKTVDADTGKATKNFSENTAKVTKNVDENTKKITSNVSENTTKITTTATTLTDKTLATGKNLFVRGGLLILGFIFVGAGLMMFRDGRINIIQGRVAP